MAAVNDGGGDGGCHRWRQWSLSMEAMSVFVTDGNDKGQQWQGRTRAWGCGRPCGTTLSSSGAKWQLLEQQQQVEMLKLAFCRLANTRVLAERQNASYNKSVFSLGFFPVLGTPTLSALFWYFLAFVRTCFLGMP